jgi:hypothetical protein
VRRAPQPRRGGPTRLTPLLSIRKSATDYKMLLAALGISVLAIGLNFLTSTSASGSNPLAVTVTNAPLAVQAPNGNSTPLPVSVNNVPNVNIASVPAVTLASGTAVGLASGTGVTVTNPLDNSGNPIPVHTRSDDDAGRTPVGAHCLTGTIQTSPQLLLTAGTQVSILCSASPTLDGPTEH